MKPTDVTDLITGGDLPAQSATEQIVTMQWSANPTQNLLTIQHG